MQSADPRRPLRIAPVPERRGSDRDPTWQRDNLPAEVSSFVGREAAIAEVADLLAAHRLVTLNGAPGVGKTRLGLRVAAELRDRFPDGVWLVELAALAEPDLVASMVASILNLREDGGRPPVEILQDHLRARQALLVLDNCEHLLDACATLVDTLLRGCPDLRVLATSREPLGSPGEVLRPVEPLTLPDDLSAALVGPVDVRGSREASPDAHASIDALLASEAGRLFVERARAVRPRLVLTSDAARAVARICQQLDGIPLAIELAAARAAALSPNEIAARLDDQFALLTRNGRAAVPRQRTLRESVDWSHALLSDAERVLLRRLSVFRGGWTLEAGQQTSRPAGEFEAVSLNSSADNSSAGLLDLLASLVQKSLVVAEDYAGETRYRFLETIRQYAAEQLRVAGEEEALARCHRDWCVALAEEASINLRGPEQGVWRARLEVEHDNLRAALGWTIDHDEAEPGLRICIALWIFWFERGYAGEGYAWVSRVLALRSASERTALRAAGLFVAAKLATEGPDLAMALAHCEESLSIAREVGDPRTIHRTLTQLGHIESGRGRWMAARRYYEEALPLRRELSEPVTVAISLRCLGDVARALHEYETARALYEEGLDLTRQQGHPGETTACQDGLGRLALEQGHYDEAAAWFAEALPVAHRIYHPRRIAYLLEGLAVLAVRQQPERALRLAGAAAALREATGNRLPPSEQATLKRDLAVARRLLSDDVMASAWAAGMTLTTDQAVALALAPKPAVPSTSSSDSAGRLTAREREVAALVAQGLTNRQIADALVVSQRTAESHVANSLSKLGLATRAQLAAWAIGHGLMAAADAWSI